MAKIFWAALLSVAFASGGAGAAAALSFKDIAGKWCGLTTDYTFTRNALTVAFHNGAPTRKFQVTSYEYLGGVIKVHWLDKGEKLYTDFGEFSASARTMAQQPNNAGPRSPFRRCK
jgi:hypothetical protein